MVMQPSPCAVVKFAFFFLAMYECASEISCSSLVSLNENVSLINDNFQSEATSKLKTCKIS